MTTVKCRCNCHDPASRKAMGIRKHKNCFLCLQALEKERSDLKKLERNMREAEENLNDAQMIYQDAKRSYSALEQRLHRTQEGGQPK